MSIKDELTVNELKCLLIARQNANEAIMHRHQQKFYSALGMDQQDEGNEDLKLKLHDIIYEIIASKLKQERCDGPLLSSAEFRNLIFENINIWFPEILDLEESECEIFKKTLETIFNGVIEAVDSEQMENQYDICWQWIEIAVELAKKNGMAAENFIASSTGFTEISRQCYSMEQYINRQLKLLDRSCNANSIMDIFIQPILEMVAGDDPESINEMRQAFEDEVMPEMRERVEEIKSVFKKIIEEDAMEIYG